MNRYQFCNEVFLTYDDTGYHVLIGNEKANESQYTSEQLKNPILAHQRFINAINNCFYKKISKYIKQTDRKKGMGCNSKAVSCIDCIEQGCNIAPGSECYLNAGQAQKLKEQ